MTATESHLDTSRAGPLQPVEPLPLPATRFVRWLLFGGFALAAVIVVGVRRDWEEAIAMWPVLGHTVVLALVAGWGAWAALRLAVPGEARPSAAFWPAAFAAVWIVWLVWELVFFPPTTSGAWTVGFGWRCIVRAMVGAAAPGAVLLVLVRRAMPLAAKPVAVALAASTAATGELAAEWMCPNTQALHLLAWHAVPLVVVVASAAVLGNHLVFSTGFVQHALRRAGAR